MLRAAMIGYAPKSVTQVAGTPGASLDCRRDRLQVRGRGGAVWSSCGVRHWEGDSLLTRRLFGSIVERDGRFTLLSYANDF